MTTRSGDLNASRGARGARLARLTVLDAYAASEQPRAGAAPFCGASGSKSSQAIVAWPARSSPIELGLGMGDTLKEARENVRSAIATEEIDRRVMLD